MPIPRSLVPDRFGYPSTVLHAMIARTTPALLLMAEYNCTLAAARCLAEHGTPVTIASSTFLAPSRWSNAVTNVVSCPDFSVGPAALSQWLLTYGRLHEKTVLYPTCDEMAWLIAYYQRKLSPWFYLYTPEHSALRTLLDKRRLHDAATAVGLETPRTWYPRSENELAGILAQAPTLIVKPRSSQTFSSLRHKGQLVSDLEELKAHWHRYGESDYAEEVVRDTSDIGMPMVQEYLPLAADEVWSISGFALRSGRIIDTRASRKLLQLPRRAGVGLCFEGADPDPRLVKLLSRLCRSIRYFGVFEAEFVTHEGRALLIDFNPRYFGQVQFDIARGMQLPWLAQLCATGHSKEAAKFAVASARADAPTYYADSRALKWHLFTGALFGAVTSRERAHWLRWLHRRPERFVDAVVAPRDRGPALAAAIHRFWRSLRHPRAFWRSVRSDATLPPPHFEATGTFRIKT